jgi:hypothetical protein
VPLRRIRPEDKKQEWRPRRSIRLYLDDVEDILAVMRQVESDPEVVVQTPVYEGTISGAEELKEAGPDRLNVLSLGVGTNERHIVVLLFPPVRVGITPRDDLQLSGAGQAIHHLLSLRQTRTGGGAPWLSAPLRSRLWLPLIVISVAVTTVSGALQVLFSEHVADFTGPIFAATMVITALLSLAYQLFFGTHPRPRAEIILAYRADAPTWWERNRTTVLISLTTNVVVAGVFFVLGLSLE